MAPPLDPPMVVCYVLDDVLFVVHWMMFVVYWMMSEDVAWAFCYERLVIIRFWLECALITLMWLCREGTNASLDT